MYGEVVALSKSVKLSFRFTQQGAEDLKKISEAEFRSQNSMVEYLVRKKAREMELNGFRNPIVDEIVNKPKKAKTVVKSQPNNDLVIWAINYLNEQTGSKFNPKAAGTTKEIKARINDKTVDLDQDKLRLVIDHKVKEWKGTKMEQYLRPSTLFNGKFYEYLAEAEKCRENNEQYQSWVEDESDTRGFFNV